MFIKIMENKEKPPIIRAKSELRGKKIINEVEK